MSTTVIEALRNHLDDDNLLDGYEVRYNRWSDQIENGAGDFVLLRMAGAGGQSNRLLQQVDVRILMVADPTTVMTAQDRIWEIADYLREPGAPAEVVKFAVLANPIGPQYLENGRGVFDLNVRVFV